MMVQRIAIFAGIIAVVIIGGFSIYLAYDIEQSDVIKTETPPKITDAPMQETQQLKKFSSEEELREFLINIQDRHTFMPSFAIAEPSMREEAVMSDRVSAESIPQSGDSKDFSSTNIQVIGVDEPDFLKTDGKYIYIVKEHNLIIIDAYPAEDARIISKVALDIEQQYLENMFLNEDRLIIFYRGHDIKEIIPKFEYKPRERSVPTTHAVILDISDREKPTIIKDYQVDGRFTDARMNGDYVYFISTNWINYDSPIIPRIVDSTSNEIILEPDIFYFEEEKNNYHFSTITALDIFDENYVNSSTFLMDSANTIYASHSGLYIASSKNLPYHYYEDMEREIFFNVVLPLLPISTQDTITQINEDTINPEQKWRLITDVLQDAYDNMSQDELKKLFDRIDDEVNKYESEKSMDYRKTVIHKILLDEGNLQYQASGEVSGWLLNQFSMDEYDDRLRIATTNERVVSDRWTIFNSVHVLDSNDLSVVGSITDLAPNESIFSARFMGDRLYLVTFERIDPFFVIDLSTDQPKVLGELKIPGFSNYLHPYDDDHIIGIGKDTKEVDGRIVQLGVKLALFDVSDVRNPTVLDDVVIGDGSTHSPILNDHKAFLFDKSKNILSIPINNMMRGWIDADDLQDSWNGFYVYGLDTQDGFTLKGKIDHLESMRSWDYNARSLYINDILYTVSTNMIKMNELDNVNNEINAIDLKPSGGLIEYLDNWLN